MTAAARRQRLLDEPAYTLREAQRLTGIGFGTLQRWSRQKPPIIRIQGDFWSFTNLVEVYTLSALRKTHQLELDDVRRAVHYVERALEVKHPLAAKVFRTDGVDLFVDEFGQLINASHEGQVAMKEVLESRLRHVEYGRDGRATRLYVDPDRHLIVIDPAVGFGRPVVTGTSVPVESIVARFQAGESASSIAEDHAIEAASVEQALRMKIRADAA